MEIAPPVIVRCPPDRREEALSLVLCEIAPSQRREIARDLSTAQADKSSAHRLYVAVRHDQVCGAVWVQPQPGRTAVLWPPQLVHAEGVSTANALAQAAEKELDRLDASLAQVLLPPGENSSIAVLSAIGFQHLADLLYLSCEANRFGTVPARSDLSFVAYHDAEHERFARLVDQTYENTLDCAALNGVRCMDDVLDGYRATGTFHAENWLRVCGAGQDVGVVILADHPQAAHWELMYMGLVPAARGRGWGRQIVKHAQWLARCAGVERIVLAVDAVNEPALAMYRAAGFEAWDRRAVYVRVRR
jgi:ribosomal protein S18 acetylase RimI-like enzyme